ncbi:hypothetical protein [Filimonas effusa]|uniref:Uncharacterized protein n=1 Tax=Filimonas effusa TaxID=2508721 RepID=A0A4Q1DAE2_9BACT|nr:hypothetical protein [Filimonas effusa]RXK85735.1 hypothetical protein ESB13_02655 [Filimonas effusa]
MMYRAAVVAMLLALFASPCFSAIKLPSLFPNHMILQQNEKVTIWGTGSPGQTITILTDWNARVTVRPDADRITQMA